MNIKVIIPYHNNLYDTLKALQKKHNIELLTPDLKHFKKIPKDINYSKVTCLGNFNKIGAVLSPKIVWKKLKKTDVIFLKHLFEPAYLFTHLQAKLRGIPLVINVQRVSYGFLKNKPWLFRLLGTILGKKTIVWCVSKEGYNDVKQYFKHSFYFPQPIDSSRFPKKIIEEKQEFTILCNSKYESRKKLDILITAYQQIEKKYPHINFKLIVFGRSYEKGKIAKHSFSEVGTFGKIKSLITTKTITLLKNLSFEEVLQQYTKGDLFIFPAKSEPLGYSLLEAMSVGLPILCSNEVGAKGSVHEGENGYHFKVNSVVAIEKAIEKYIVNKETINWAKLKEHGNHSLQIIQKEHNPKSFVKTIDHKLKKIIA